MFKRGKAKAAKENAVVVAALAAQLAADERFRNRLLEASMHGVRAKRRVRRQRGAIALATRLARDQELGYELAQLSQELRAAWQQVERARARRRRKRLLALAGAGGAVAAAAPPARRWLDRQGHEVSVRLDRPRTIAAAMEVEVPVSTAYNQWTQFEDFPRFMNGVEEVRQLDDTLLHWAASVGGKRIEWDAKILEQHPDQQISWISEDGKKTRGTVSFESRGESRTLLTLSMSYQRQGLREALGSAAGVDRRRVRGDLHRFKKLIETRGSETGAWRRDVSAGTTGTSTPP